MATFSFADGAAMFDSTPIENLFLLEYLPKAPEAFLRVYLYARMLALHPELGDDVTQTARALQLDEEAVYAAFAYWERQGLAVRLTDRPPTYALLPVRGEGGGTRSQEEQTYYAYRDFNASLQALFGANLIESRDYRVANDWLNVLGYDQDAVLKLVEYGIQTSRSGQPKPRGVFERMDKLAAKWADRGCRTLEDVERAIAEDEGVNGIAKAVLQQFGQTRKPSLPELDCVKRWVGEWGFTQEEILSACGETTKANKPTFAYLDAVLKNRHEGDDGRFRELADILRELDAAQAQPTPDQLERYDRLLARGFEPATVKLAAVQCHRKKKTRFEDVEWMLDQWAEDGLFAADAAQAYVTEMQARRRRTREILQRCGLDRRPNMDDLALYGEWRKAHDEAMIDYAASCSRGMDKPMKFANWLLNDWAGNGVKTVEQAEARREALRVDRSVREASANPALNYSQREYREEDYGDDFYVDLDKYVEGGEQA